MVVEDLPGILDCHPVQLSIVPRPCGRDPRFCQQAGRREGG